MVNYSQTIDETVATKEEKTPTHQYVTSLSETVGTADFYTRIADLTRYLDETVGTADAVPTRVGGLQNMEGIANLQFSTVEKKTWEGATEWDNAVSENGVVHEDDANRDIAGSGVIQLGYPSYDLTGTASLRNYWPFDQDSGGSLYDAVSGETLSFNGTQGSTGLHNTTCVTFADDDATATTPNFDASTFTTSFWIKTTETTATTIFKHNMSSGIFRADINVGSSNEIRLWHSDGSHTAVEADGIAVNDGAWYHIAMVRRGTAASDHEVWVNGTNYSNILRNNSSSNMTLNDWDFGDNDSNRPYYGDLEDYRWYTSALSGSQITALSNVGSQGNLLTQTKSFATTVQPDLEQLSYSLNSQTIDLDVIGSPGTASEEIVTQRLGGATAYGLSWTNSHQDFRIDIKPSTTDPTTSPTLSSITLTT